MKPPIYINAKKLLSCIDTPCDLLSKKTQFISQNLLGNEIRSPYNFLSGADESRPASEIFNTLDELVEPLLAEAGLMFSSSASSADDSSLSVCSGERIGLFIGSTSYSLRVSEEEYQSALAVDKHAHPFGFSAYNALADHVIGKFLPLSLSYTFSTACTSSANAMLYAAELLRDDVIDHALVLGLEFYNDITLRGFNALNLISPSASMQPFGEGSDGLVLGEACSGVVLSREKTNNTFSCLLGGATLSDTYGMTAANPNGETIQEVMQSALQACELTVKDIAGMKLHGTASVANDTAEYAGVNLLFGNAQPPSCVLKPILGHTLGACGTSELVLLLESLKHGKIPGLVEPYPLNPEFNVSLSADDQKIDSGPVLLNYFGFGGNNSAVIIDLL